MCKSLIGIELGNVYVLVCYPDNAFVEAWIVISYFYKLVGKVDLEKPSKWT